MQTNAGGLSSGGNVTSRSRRDLGEVPCHASVRVKMAVKLDSDSLGAVAATPATVLFVQ